MIAVAVPIEIAWPGQSSLGLWVLLIWLVPALFRMRADYINVLARQTVERTELAEKRLIVEDLEHQLAQARALLDGREARAWGHQLRLAEAADCIARLEEELRSAKVRRQASANHTPFRRVGLDPGCPKWVAECVRREYRKRLHPDTKPLHQKSEAERRFKEAEHVFDQVWRIREF